MSKFDAVIKGMGNREDQLKALVGFLGDSNTKYTLWEQDNGTTRIGVKLEHLHYSWILTRTEVDEVAAGVRLRLREIEDRIWRLDHPVSGI